MIFKLEDTSKAAPLFAGWPDSCITSCLQRVMGEVFVTDTEAPRCAMAYLGDFAFYAGEPDAELFNAVLKDGLVMVPLNEGWARLIEKSFPQAKKAVRYSTKKDTRFDREKLKALAASLPKGYELCPIEGGLLDRCFAEGYFAPFGSRANYSATGGRGFAVMKAGDIAAAASSYSRYREGIEVDVMTAEKERRKGLASAAAAALILRCLDEGLYPSWDAANPVSLRLAQKLGYEFGREYTVYEI